MGKTLPLSASGRLARRWGTPSADAPFTSSSGQPRLTARLKLSITSASEPACSIAPPRRMHVENELMITPYKDVTVVNFQNVSVLDSANIEALGRSLMELVEKQDTRKLILEFSAVRFMSSQALGIL